MSSLPTLIFNCYVLQLHFFTSFLHLLYSSFLLPLQTHAVCPQKQEKESLTQLYKIHLLLLNVNSLTQIHLLLLNVNSLTQLYKIHLLLLNVNSLTQLYKIHLLLLNVNSLTRLYKIHLLLLNVNSLTRLYKIHLLPLNVNSFLCFCQKISPSCGLKKFSHF